MVHQGPHGAECWHMWHFTLTAAVYFCLSPHRLPSVFRSCRSLFVFSLRTQALEKWQLNDDMTWHYRYRLQPLPGWWLCRALWHWSAPSHPCQRPCLSHILHNDFAETGNTRCFLTCAAFKHLKQLSSLSSPLYAKLQDADLDVQQRVQGLSHLRWSKPDRQPV